MGAKQIRIARLFHPETGKAVNIPVDHGAGGNPQGLEDPVAVLQRLIELGIDSTLMNKGLGKITEHLFESKAAPGRILTCDTMLTSVWPGRNEKPMRHEVVATVEEALRGDYACVKVLLVFGSEVDTVLRNMKIVADLATECDRWNMPLMVEPVMWGENIPQEKKLDPELVMHGARMALEFGCDVLKMPYTGNQAEFADLVRRVHIPVVILGGPKMKSIRDVFVVAHDACAAGARGVVFGRNVWQNPNMDAVVRALQAIIHGGQAVDAVMKSPAYQALSV